MKSTNLNRLLIPQPFASGNGAALTPIEKSSGTMPNFEDGIPANFSAPKSGGGSYFQRGMMNAIGNMASANSFFHQCGGYHCFDQEVCDAIGGYPNGCVLHWLTNGKFVAVESLVDDNTWNFTTDGIDGSHWRLVSSDGINFPTFDKSKKQTLWANSAMSIGNTFEAISAQVEMPFDGYVNYLSSIRASIPSIQITAVTAYSSSSATQTMFPPYTPAGVLTQSYFWAVLAISSPDDNGVAPDIIIDTSDPIAGERNCSVFLVDGMGVAASGAGCGLVPVSKGSKIRLYGQETFTYEVTVHSTKIVTTTDGSTTIDEPTTIKGSFSGWTTLEAYPIFGG